MIFFHILTKRFSGIPVIRLLSAVVAFLLYAPAHAQDTTAITGKTLLSTSQPQDMLKDTVKKTEDARLDIAQDRGLFIVTPDRMMQLRILGSVRFLAVYDNRELGSKSSFRTSEIPIGEGDFLFPNYFNSLSQTRLGFEVTRKTSDSKGVFIRLETDFAGSNGYRIRHAYGEFKNVLFGQTWSLFSHITSIPGTVNSGGPIGSISTRTPQFRYYLKRPVVGMDAAMGLEYFVPNIQIPDSVNAKAFQLLPGLTARLQRSGSWGSFKIAGIVPILSGRNETNDLVVRAGWGISSSAVINTWLNGKWFTQVVAGRAISQFVNNLSDHGSDVLIESSTQLVLPLSVGGFVTYEHDWTPELYSNLTFGLVQTEKTDFQDEDTYLRGYSVDFNTFWNVVEGARIGMEVIWGTRVNYDLSSGKGVRVNMLVYYDF
ncbi:MAG: hypothetical protein IT270_12625 [Saprospiraceae bacterium]|nr:hypothetical protein [Saprospiraceae bacterium]